jgi:hypothetical protein
MNGVAHVSTVWSIPGFSQLCSYSSSGEKGERLCIKSTQPIWRFLFPSHPQSITVSIAHQIQPPLNISSRTFLLCPHKQSTSKTHQNALLFPRHCLGRCEHRAGIRHPRQEYTHGPSSGRHSLHRRRQFGCLLRHRCTRCG